MVSQTTDDNLLSKNISEEQIMIEEIDSSKELGEQENITIEKTTEELVRDYFVDTPVMADIAFCESRFRQFDQYGNPLRGIQNSADVGVMQINEKYHAATAIKLGINIYTLEGNMEYAKYLYDTKGTRPWVHSSDCWNTVREIALNN